MTDISSAFDQQFNAGTANIEAGASAISAALSAAASFSVPGYAWSGVALGGHGTITTADHHITAQYHQPTPAPGTNINLDVINALDPLHLPAAYVINTDGLFKEVPPDIADRVFDVLPPTVNWDEIQAYLDSIDVPVITDIPMPVLTDITIRPVPVLDIPSFTPTVTGDDIDVGMPVNQQPILVAEYDRLRPEVQAWLNRNVSGWIDAYAPDYHAALQQVEDKLDQVIQSGQMLRSDYYDQLKAKSRNEAENDYNGLVETIESDQRRRGFKALPQFVEAARLMARQQTNNAIASQSVVRELKLIEMETANMQWAVNASMQLRQALLQGALSWAGLVAGMNQQAFSQAKTFVDTYNQYYENLVKRASLLLDQLRVEALIYDTQLKAALAVLEGYKLEIETSKLILELDAQRLDFITKQIALEIAKVQIYSDLIKSVEVRAEVEMSKVKLFAEQVDAYNAQLTGDKLKIDVYIAALSGDEAKLKSELAKLEAWEKTVDTLIKERSNEIAQQELIIRKNTLTLDEKKTEWAVYRDRLLAAGQLFESELKGELAIIDAYKTDIEAKVQVLNSQYELDRLLLNQDEFNAKQLSEGLQAQAANLNQHYQFLANLSERIGEVFTNAGAASLNAQITAFTSQATV